MTNFQPKIKNDSFDFDSITLKIASPERIKEWSHGEVTRPETINYRTQRSEKNGLFCEKIFGPERDFECYCGKYRGIRYKGIVCEKCGVEITRSIVRRERMGHIELATPVAHVWFLKNVPSRMALVLGISAGDVEKVVYFAGYIITSVSTEEKERLLKEAEAEYKSKLKTLQDDKSKDKLKEIYTGVKKEIQNIEVGKVIDDLTHHRFATKYGALFEAKIGAEAIYEVFKNTDLKKLSVSVKADLEKSGSTDRDRLLKRLGLINAMIKSGVRPEWMFLTSIPVIPPALRPMVLLEGGRHATSDVNDLYRRVINRNNRLKKLIEINAPSVILRNEKRILQEAVDALIDNSVRRSSQSSGATSQAQRRPLKSLADALKGKQGLFRGNLLGKRVDYSGRSVIVVGPDLKLNQCGIPKHMALELFKPFIIAKLRERELAFNIPGARKLIDERIPEVWAILDEVIQGKYVLLNRAPTLHRLSIQAFQPILIEGNALQIHPLVCTAFNADFDGDQMAVHVPLSEEAQLEAREFMVADKNLLKPGSGDPIISIDKQDMILGVYWTTEFSVNAKGEGKIFTSPNEAISTYEFGGVALQAKIKVLPDSTPRYKKFEGKVFETSVGRILFNNVLPEDYPFVNEEIGRKVMSTIVNNLIENYGVANVAPILDSIKHFGFQYATVSGISMGIDDIRVPEEKFPLIEKAKKDSGHINDQYEEGLLSFDEKYRKNIEIWHKLRTDVEKVVDETLDKKSSVYYMLKSGARGSLQQITNMIGLKGLIAGTGGKTVEFPILSSNKEGLSQVEYFTTTHGARKGLGDTALNTSRSGYLTRKLFDVSQDIVVMEKDCGSKEGVTLKNERMSGIEISLAKSLPGRILAKDLELPDGKTFKRGHLLTKEDAKNIYASGVKEAVVRSPITCKTGAGICANCYGVDLGRGGMIEIGEAVGTVSAQAVGEPATQLTMRTFHAGGTASTTGDIVAGLPRVEELFERRLPKNPAIVATVDGIVSEIKNLGKETLLIVSPAASEDKKANIEYTIIFRRTPFVKEGDEVKKGDILTDGSVDLSELFKYAGKQKTQEYLIREIMQVYELQGAPVARKHIEIVIRQMFSRKRVKDAGDTKFSIGEIVEEWVFNKENEKVKAEGLVEAKAIDLVLGITNVSLTRQSFLSAASFQNTNRVLIDSALRGSEDHLQGLKENVIIGRLIPAGSGLAGSPKAQRIAEYQEQHKEISEDLF